MGSCTRLAAAPFLGLKISLKNCNFLWLLCGLYVTIFMTKDVKLLSIKFYVR